MEGYPKRINRLDYLDSLRGIAAISVVISHFVLAYRLDLEFKILNFSPLHFFYDGFAAVTLFFILSGYVLTLSLEKNKSVDIINFYLKRVVRIIPAYLFTLMASFIAYKSFQIIHTTPQSSPWISGFWNRPLDLYHFYKQLIFLKPGENAELVPQNWSLQVEMIFSFLMPFLYLLYKKSNQFYFWIFIIVLYLFFKMPVFILHFSLGIFLALNQNKVINSFLAIKVKYRIILIGTILFFYTYRYTLPMYYYYYARVHSIVLNNDDLIWAITGLGAFLVLVYCISSQKLKKTLNLKGFVFIGKISYSIYLVHMIILIFVVPYFIEYVNYLGILNKYIVWTLSLLFLLSLTILSSCILTFFIEIPLAKAGNRLIKKRQGFFSKIEI